MRVPEVINGVFKIISPWLIGEVNKCLVASALFLLLFCDVSVCVVAVIVSPALISEDCLR